MPYKHGLFEVYNCKYLGNGNDDDDEKLVDNEQSYQGLKSGDIKGETGSTILAAQGQAIFRINF
jgi:hypothetical protein